MNYVQMTNKLKKLRSYESIIRTLIFATNTQYHSGCNEAYIFSVNGTVIEIFLDCIDMVTFGIHKYYATDIYTTNEIKSINSILIPLFKTMIIMRNLKAKLEGKY